MAVKIEIIIPSMGRAERVLTTKNCITHCKLCVPESEKCAYEEYNPGVEVFTHPDSLKGLALKRQIRRQYALNTGRMSVARRKRRTRLRRAIFLIKEFG